jgi:hypothetical protein
MTVSSTTTKNSYSGNGSTTTFAYGFKIFADADLTVILRSSTGVETVQSLTTNYTVTNAGNASGGNVVFGSAPASGVTVVIRRNMALTQSTDYVATDHFKLLIDAVSAATSATNAASSATAAASSATTASTQASNASTSASTASTQATNAANSATAAAASAAAAATSADNFDDVYLGAKSSEPSTDNDGDALNAGDLFFDTTANALKVYTGSAWQITTQASLTSVAGDTSPQLGGDLDVNGNALVSTSNGNIALTPNGTGLVRIDGNVDIQTGEIVLKNGGSQSNIKFYCESANAHYAQLTAPAHADFGGNITIVLPATAGTLALTSQLPTSGISSGNVATFGSGVADDDFLRVNGTTIEGRSASEVASDIGATTKGFAVAMAIAL